MNACTGGPVGAAMDLADAYANALVSGGCADTRRAALEQYLQGAFAGCPGLGPPLLQVGQSCWRCYGRGYYIVGPVRTVVDCEVCRLRRESWGAKCLGDRP